MRSLSAVRDIVRSMRLETLALAAAIAILVGVTVAQQRTGAPSSPLDSYSTYDAGSGGYRAFYELLAREGLRVERFELRPAFLDSTIATLVYAEPVARDPRAQDPTRADIDELEAWVRGGGSLFYIGSDDAAAAAGILGLPRVARARPRAGDEARSAIAPDLRALGVANIAAGEVLRYAVVPRRIRVLLGDGRGALVVRYALGRGNVTAAIDRVAFDNAGIVVGDRARLAYALARPTRRDGVVAFDEVPHGYATPDRWWSIVPRPFAIALGIALAALLIAIAGAALRLGPPLVPVPRDDRSSADFVDAVASLYERNGDVRGTLVDAAASTTRAIARAHGLASTATNEEIAARIERNDVRASFVTMTRLASDGFADDSTLVRGIALAQRLRKDLTAHGGSRN